jgi:hypothetical protein
MHENGLETGGAFVVNKDKKRSGKEFEVCNAKYVLGMKQVVTNPDRQLGCWWRTEGNWVCSRWSWRSRRTGRVVGVGKAERAARMPGHIGGAGDPSINDL